MVACKKQGQDYVQVGAIVGQVPGPQTVFRGEMYAVLQLARYTEGPIDTTLDCLGVPKRVRSPKPGKTHGDIWWELQATDVNRLKMKWVPSHVSEEEFLRKVGAENSWRQQVNDLADKLCGEKAAELARPDARAASQYQDHCSKKAQEFLASRAEKILTAVGENQHPVYKVFLQEKQARKHPEATARPCKKRIGSNIGRGHTTTQQEWFQELVRTKSVHAWEWEGHNLRCAQCQLKLLHTKNRKTLEALAAHQCAHQGRVAIEGVHVTHVLKLLGTRQLWLCEGCGGQLSLKTQTVSQKLAAACSFKKDSRCKSQFKPETTNPIRSLFQPAQAAKPVEGAPLCAMAEVKQEDLPSQGQEAQEAPVKSEGEKPEGGASPEQEALNHPTGADTQEGLPSQASASSKRPLPRRRRKATRNHQPQHRQGRGSLRGLSLGE